MSESIADPAAPPPVVASGGDLSREIERSVSREPSDRVRCVRVCGDHYRCNWWAPATASNDPRAPMAEWAVTALHRVRKSRFLRATNAPGRLVIVEVSRDEPYVGNFVAAK